MLKYLFCSAICLTSLFVYAGEQLDNRVYECSFVDGDGVKMDGKLDDPIWGKIPASGNFFMLRSFAAACEMTTFKAFWTKNALHVAVDCAVANPKYFKESLATDNGAVWRDDGVELFVEPPAAGGAYRHFICNVMGKRYNGVRMDKIGLGSWEGAAERNAQGYTMELRIPFSCVGQSPEPGAVWRFNVTRNSFPKDDEAHYTWSLNPESKSAGFHDPRRFGHLHFADKVSAEGEGPMQGVVELFRKADYLSRCEENLAWIEKYLDEAPADYKKMPPLEKLRIILDEEKGTFAKMAGKWSLEEAKKMCEELESFKSRVKRTLQLLMVEELTANPQELKSYAQALGEGLEFKKKRDFKAALDAFVQAAKLAAKDDERFQALFYAGTACRDLGEWKKLLELCAGAMDACEGSKYSGSFKLRIELLYAMAMRNCGQADKAIEYLRGVIKEHDSSEAKISLAQVLFEKGRKDETERLLQEAMKGKLEPGQFGVASHYLGRIDQERGDYRKAADNFGAVLKCNEGPKYMAITRGASCLLALGEPWEAIDFLSRAASMGSLYAGQRAELDALAERAFAQLGNGATAAKKKSVPPAAVEFVKAALRDKLAENSRETSTLRQEFPEAKAPLSLLETQRELVGRVERLNIPDSSELVEVWTHVEGLRNKVAMARKTLSQSEGL